MTVRETLFSIDSAAGFICASPPNVIKGKAGCFVTFFLHFLLKFIEVMYFFTIHSELIFAYLVWNRSFSL